MPVLAKNLDTLDVADQASSPSAVDSKDDRQPYTDSYSFTIVAAPALVEPCWKWPTWATRATTWRLTSGAGSEYQPGSGGRHAVSRNGGVDPNSLTADDFRPLKGFSDLNLATNKGYANYNALQVTWVRTKGRYTINMNYTFGKAMGICRTPTLDQFNLDQQLRRAAANRTHIFNAAYSIELGNSGQDKIAGGFVNGWQLSGITQIAKRRQPLRVQRRTATSA